MEHCKNVATPIKDKVVVKNGHMNLRLEAGFDRDLMRLFGYNFENTDKPNNWDN